jgi:hypothetical protein
LSFAGTGTKTFSPEPGPKKVTLQILSHGPNNPSSGHPCFDWLVLPNAKPIIGFVRLFGILIIDTARLFSIKVSSVFIFCENISNDDNNLKDN